MQIEITKEMLELMLADYEYQAHQLRFEVTDFHDTNSLTTHLRKAAGGHRISLFNNYREIAAHLRSEAEMEPWECCRVCTPEYYETPSEGRNES